MIKDPDDVRQVVMPAVVFDRFQAWLEAHGLETSEPVRLREDDLPTYFVRFQ